MFESIYSNYFVKEGLSFSIKIWAMEKKMNSCFNSTTGAAIYWILKVKLKFKFF